MLRMINGRGGLTRRVTYGAAAGVAVGVLCGCQPANPAMKRSQQAVGVLVDTRQSLRDADQTVADAQAALRTLGASKGDLQPPFAGFVAATEAVRRQADRQRLDGQDVVARASAYCAARRGDIGTINNAALRHTAETRAAQVQAQADAIQSHYALVAAGFAVYLRDLGDLRTYLANDLSYAALDSARASVAEAQASGDRLRVTLRELAGRVEQMSSDLSPAPIATTPWPTTAGVAPRPATAPTMGPTAGPATAPVPRN